MMSHDEGQRCLCVTEHRPYPLELERHHILPQALGGLSTEDNLVFICPTCHTSTHELMRLMFTAGRALSDYELQVIEDRPVSRYAAALAREGYHLFTAAKETTL